VEGNVPASVAAAAAIVNSFFNMRCLQEEFLIYYF
jgi:hypothetical protein